MQVFYKVTGDRIDKRRRIPVFLSHVWGTLLMALTGCFPKIENGEIIRDFHKRCVFFVIDVVNFIHRVGRDDISEKSQFA